MVSITDMVYEQCADLGFKPVSKTPTKILDAIRLMYSARFTEGADSKKCAMGLFLSETTIDLGWTPIAVAGISTGPHGHKGGYHNPTEGIHYGWWQAGSQGGASSSPVMVVENGVSTNFYGNPGRGYYIAIG